MLTAFHSRPQELDALCFWEWGSGRLVQLSNCTMAICSQSLLLEVLRSLCSASDWLSWGVNWMYNSHLLMTLVGGKGAASWGTWAMFGSVLRQCSGSACVVGFWIRIVIVSTWKANCMSFILLLWFWMILFLISLKWHITLVFSPYIKKKEEILDLRIQQWLELSDRVNVLHIRGPVISHRTAPPKANQNKTKPEKENWDWSEFSWW